jgi:hypothetical protein
MNTTNLQLPKLNMILLLLISFVPTSYKHGKYVFFIVWGLIFLLIVFNLFKGIYKNKQVTMNGSLVLLFFAALMASPFVLHNKVGMHVYVVSYFFIFFILIYGFIMFKKYEIRYGEQFFRQFTVLMNILSIMNLYQIILMRPFFANLLIDNLYQGSSYGNSTFRTISIFGHPIVCGLFFSLLFICNIYLIKGKYKYLLQILALVNIYSTMSRSAWISLFIVLALYGLKNIKLKKLNIDKSFKWTEVFVGYFIAIALIISVGFMIINVVVKSKNKV